MMSENLIVKHFSFESQETYERAKKEAGVIDSMRAKYDLTDVKVACQVYAKAVEGKAFSTAVGYSFLEELRATILSSGKVPEKKLPRVPVRGEAAEGSASAPVFGSRGDGRGGRNRYRMLYEGQVILNKRLKVALFALFVIVAAFITVDLKSEYSIFTYFTDYKAKMEEELVNKYEKWENDLSARENALKQESGSETPK